MNDLVKRLRHNDHGFDRNSSHSEDRYVCLCDHTARAAADEIERLQKERDDFHMNYRMKCDEETKALQEQLAACQKELEEAKQARMVCGLCDAKIEAAIDAAMKREGTK